MLDLENCLTAGVRLCLYPLTQLHKHSAGPLLIINLSFFLSLLFIYTPKSLYVCSSFYTFQTFRPSVNGHQIQHEYQ